MNIIYKCSNTDIKSLNIKLEMYTFKSICKYFNKCANIYPICYSFKYAVYFIAIQKHRVDIQIMIVHNTQSIMNIHYVS